jgi:hypothetical protein
VKSLRSFVLFLGRGRSGSSLCGGLLNCHPNAVVVHEKEFLNFKYKNEKELYNYLIQSQNKKRHLWKPLRGRDDWEWITNHDNLKVIGTKKQGTFIKHMTHFNRLDALKEKLSIPVKFINIYRNPFDNIATIYNKSQKRKNILSDKNMKSLDRAITYYFNGAKMTQAVIDRELFINVQHESLVNNPKEILSEICDFLGLPILEDYLDYCENFIWKSPRKTRESVKWSGNQIDRVTRLKNKYSFLAKYTWED